MSLLEELDEQIKSTEDDLSALQRAREVIVRADRRDGRAIARATAPLALPPAPAKTRARKAASAAPTSPVAEKQCPTCKKTKPAADYNVNRSRVDGLQTQCRSCQNAESRAVRAKARAAAEARPQASRSKADDADDDQEADVKPAPAIPAKPSATRPITDAFAVRPGGAYGRTKPHRAKVKHPERRELVCRACEERVPSHRAGAHQWEKHKRAMPAADVERFYTEAK